MVRPLFFTLVSLTWLMTGTLFAQQQKETENQNSSSVSFEAGVDLVSRYIFRGQEYGQSPALQPSLSATWKGITLGTWGSYKTNGAGWQETDFYLSKALGPVTFELWDYWNFSDTLETDIFNYKKSTTTHLLLADVILSGGEAFPVNFLTSYLFYGADTERSLYLELQYLCSIGSYDLQFFSGYQPIGTYYGTEGSFVNVGCSAIRNLQVTPKWEVPLKISLIMNPNKKSLYLTAAISL